MPFNYEIPRITEPDYQAPESVSPVYDSTSWTDDRTSILKGHYWKRIYGTVVGCGQEFTAKISTKIGVSHTVIEETSDSLELSIPSLKATLGSKVSHTDLLNREDTIEMSRKICAKECDAVTFAEWQRCDRLEITRFRKLRRAKTYTLDIPLNETCPDHLDYADPQCCPTKFDDKLKQGYSEVYRVQLEEMIYAVLTRRLASGKVQLDRLEGIFMPGQTIRTVDFPDFFGDKDEIAVIGQYPMATAERFYRMRKPQPTPHIDLIPWFVAAIGISAIATIFARRLKDAESLHTGDQAVDPYRRSSPIFKHTTEQVESEAESKQQDYESQY
jgi:hypothetical protein